MARAQQGLVMIVALLVLVVLTVAALGLMGSVDSTTMLAGNLAFKKAATRAGDTGTEAAIQKIQSLTPLQRDVDQAGSGYFASMRSIDSPSAGSVGNAWPQVWRSRFAPVAQSFTDTNGNTVAYVIHRECASAGPPWTSNCVASPAVMSSSRSGEGAEDFNYLVPQQVYYRITVRITGPRRTESYVQMHVAL